MSEDDLNTLEQIAEQAEFAMGLETSRLIFRAVKELRNARAALVSDEGR